MYWRGVLAYRMHEKGTRVVRKGRGLACPAQPHDAVEARSAVLCLLGVYCCNESYMALAQVSSNHTLRSLLQETCRSSPPCRTHASSPPLQTHPVSSCPPRRRRGPSPTWARPRPAVRLPMGAAAGTRARHVAGYGRRQRSPPRRPGPGRGRGGGLGPLVPWCGLVGCRRRGGI